MGLRHNFPAFKVAAKKNETESLAAKALAFSLTNQPGQFDHPIPADDRSQTAALRSQLMDRIFSHRTHIMDPSLGFNSKIMPNNELQGRNIWVRRISQEMAARNNHAASDNAPYNYLSLFYTYLIAAATLSEIHQFANADFIDKLQRLRDVASKQFQAALNSPSIAEEKKRIELAKKALAEAKGLLIDLIQSAINPSALVQNPAEEDQSDEENVPLLEPIEKAIVKNGNAYTKEQIGKMLDRTKDWAGLERDALAVTTVIDPSNDQEQRIVIIDEPQTELTFDQQRYFTNPNDQAWFKELDENTQALVLYYAPRILSGRCTIPSQLRSVLPVGKNAYRQSIFIEENGQLRLLNTYFHTGTVAHLSHKDDAVATQATSCNLSQQLTNSGAHASLVKSPIPSLALKKKFKPIAIKLTIVKSFN